MIYTSYYANVNNFSKKLTPVSISRFAPEWYDGLHDTNLAPPEELLLGYKAGKYSKEDYIRIYNDYLNTLSPFDIHAKYQDHLLLCYEKTEDFCHRHLLSEWLNKNGIGCVEKTLNNYLVIIDNDNDNKEGINCKIKTLELNKKNDIFILYSDEITNERTEWADYIIHFTKSGKSNLNVNNKPCVVYANTTKPFAVRLIKSATKKICNSTPGSLFVTPQNCDEFESNIILDNLLSVRTKLSAGNSKKSFFDDSPEHFDFLVNDLKFLWKSAKNQNKNINFTNNFFTTAYSNLNNHSPALFKKFNESIDAFFALKRV